MLKGNWLRKLAAIGLTLLACSGQAEEQSNRAQGEAQAEQQKPESIPVTPIIPQPLAVEVVESDASAYARERREQERDQREIDDLIAQQGMNSATQSIEQATRDMRDYALYSTGAVVIGTFLLLLNLWQVRNANLNALKAVDVTERIGKDQTRAYLSVPSADLYWRSESGSEMRVSIVVSNDGQTPARWFEIRHVFFTGPRTEDGRVLSKPNFEDIDFSGCEFKRWNALGKEFSVPLAPDPRRQGPSWAAGVMRDREKFALHLAGTVRYETFFGEVFETDFWFFNSGLGPFHTKSADYTSNGRRVNVEQPYKMPQITNSLRAYVLKDSRK